MFPVLIISVPIADLLICVVAFDVKQHRRKESMTSRSLPVGYTEMPLTRGPALSQPPLPVDVEDGPALHGPTGVASVGAHRPDSRPWCPRAGGGPSLLSAIRSRQPSNEPEGTLKAG